MKNNKQYAIVMGITDTWYFAAGTILAGLAKHMTHTNYDVYVMVDKPNQKGNDALQNIHPCIIKEFDNPFHGIDMDKFKRVSLMAFSRFECFNMLEDYDKIMWIDADAVILKDFSKIFESNKSDVSMYLHVNTPISVSFNKPLPKYDMSAGCYNDGIFVLNNNIKNGREISMWAYKKTIEYYDYIASDQAIFNLLLQEFNLRVHPLNIMYNCPQYKFNKQTCILHPWGKSKLWNDIYNFQWEEYYRLWLRYGERTNLTGNKFMKYMKHLVKMNVHKFRSF